MLSRRRYLPRRRYGAFDDFHAAISRGHAATPFITLERVITV